MKTTINVENLLDLINEAAENDYEYKKSSAIYYRKHGHGVYMDHAKTDEERHIVYSSGTVEISDRVVWSLFHVFGLNGYRNEAGARAYSAARALRRWYKMTSWQQCPPAALIDRLGSWIFQAA